METDHSDWIEGRSCTGKDPYTPGEAGVRKVPLSPKAGTAHERAGIVKPPSCDDASRKMREYQSLQPRRIMLARRGLAVPGGVAAVEPAERAGIPRDIGDAPVIARAQKFEHRLLGLAGIHERDGADRLERPGVIHLDCEVRNIPVLAPDERIAVKHRRLAAFDRGSAVFDDERGKPEGEIAAHCLYGVERDAFGGAGGAADIALVDICEKRLRGRPTAGERRRHRN